jgi:xanthine dehydrogenase accessory factor
VAAGVPYIGLVASKARGVAVLDALQLSVEQRARIRTPAGLAIGARTPAESALAILAEITAMRPAPPADDTTVLPGPHHEQPPAE